MIILSCVGGFSGPLRASCQAEEKEVSNKVAESGNKMAYSVGEAMSSAATISPPSSVSSTPSGPPGTI